MKLRKYLEEKVKFKGKDIGWKSYPAGWDRSSVQKFARSITKDSGKKPDDKGWFDACVGKIKGKLDEPEAFCASVRDEVKGTTMWRGKHKEKK